MLGVEPESVFVDLILEIDLVTGLLAGSSRSQPKLAVPLAQVFPDTLKAGKGKDRLIAKFLLVKITLDNIQTHA